MVFPRSSLNCVKTSLVWAACVRTLPALVSVLVQLAKRAAENSWQVRKGEKGTHIEFWKAKAKPEEWDDESSKNGQPPTRQRY